MAEWDTTLNLNVTSDLFSLVAIKCKMLDCKNHSKSSTDCELKHITLDENGLCEQLEFIEKEETTTNP